MSLAQCNSMGCAGHVPHVVSRSAGILFLLSMTIVGLHASAASTDERTIGVFVALCDNVHQGIVPVPKAIGNGDDPGRNLYWGNEEGFSGVFDKSPNWKKEHAAETASENVLRSCTYRSTSGHTILKAFAYRGSAIETCLRDFEQAVHQGKYDLVAYLGHNGLMDFSLQLPAGEPIPAKRPECIVLCCKSESFFRARIETMRAKPVLLTTQLMYPGAFILRDVLEDWMKGSGLKAIGTPQDAPMLPIKGFRKRQLWAFSPIWRAGKRLTKRLTRENSLVAGALQQQLPPHRRPNALCDRG